MAEHEDSRISAGYRALGDEHPPKAIDDAILAASRRAVRAGPRRPGSAMRRWALPVSIAAVVVLTMSLVVRIQLERPELESPLPAPAAPPAIAEKTAPRDAKEEADALAKRAELPQAQPKSKTSAAPSAAEERERASVARQARPAVPAAEPAHRFVPEPPAAPAPVPAESVAPSQLGAAGAAGAAAPAVAPSVAENRADRALSEDRAQAFKQPAGKKDKSPREWLERIARLRREGHAKEADESLAEFRKRYPDYEIPKEMRAAVLGADARE